MTTSPVPVMADVWPDGQDQDVIEVIITLLKLKLNVSNLSYTLSCTFNRLKINKYDFTAIEILISVF